MFYSAAVDSPHICIINSCAQHRFHGLASYFCDAFRIFCLHFLVHRIVKGLFGAFGDDFKITLANASGLISRGNMTSADFLLLE